MSVLLQPRPARAVASKALLLSFDERRPSGLRSHVPEPGCARVCVCVSPEPAEVEDSSNGWASVPGHHRPSKSQVSVMAAELDEDGALLAAAVPAPSPLAAEQPFKTKRNFSREHGSPDVARALGAGLGRADVQLQVPVHRGWIGCRWREGWWSRWRATRCGDLRSAVGDYHLVSR
jgi:hypothetical protein